MDGVATLNTPREAAGPFVSVVTPFYNTAPFLAECIESVLAQTHGNFEYILHDNASTDGSSEIARSYAEKDPRIRYIRVDTLVPQIPNYNRTLEHVDPRAQWVKIVQADDWIERRCLEEMVAVGAKSARIGVITSFRRREGDLLGCGPEYQRSVVPGREIVRAELLGHYFVLGSPTTVMYRADLVRARRPFYELGLLFPDTEACYQMLREWDLGFVHQVLSFSRRRPGSIYSTIVSRDGHVLGEMILAWKYGRDVLSPEEFERRWTDRRDTLYSRYGMALLKGAPEAYWTMHRDGLRSAGLELERGRVLRNAATHVVRALLRPKLAVAIFRDRAAAARAR